MPPCASASLNGFGTPSLRQCPVGQYRTPRSVECEDCHPGTLSSQSPKHSLDYEGLDHSDLRYSLQAGMSQCDVCPSGADCPGNSQPAPQKSFRTVRWEQSHPPESALRVFAKPGAQPSEPLHPLQVPLRTCQQASIAYQSRLSRALSCLGASGIQLPGR